MNRFVRPVAGLLASLVLAFAFGCGLSDAERVEQDLAQAYAEIDAAIGDAEASSRAACRALPLGAKPCGGPWFYRIYSAEATDSLALARLAERYTEIDRERMRGQYSDCMMTGPPPILFEGGRCTAPVPTTGPIPPLD